MKPISCILATFCCSDCTTCFGMLIGTMKYLENIWRAHNKYPVNLSEQADNSNWMIISLVVCVMRKYGYVFVWVFFYYNILTWLGIKILGIWNMEVALKKFQGSSFVVWWPWLYLCDICITRLTLASVVRHKNQQADTCPLLWPATLWTWERMGWCNCHSAGKCVVIVLASGLDAAPPAPHPP